MHADASTSYTDPSAQDLKIERCRWQKKINIKQVFNVQTKFGFRKRAQTRLANVNMKTTSAERGEEEEKEKGGKMEKDVGGLGVKREGRGGERRGGQA